MSNSKLRRQAKELEKITARRALESELKLQAGSLDPIPPSIGSGSVSKLPGYYRNGARRGVKYSPRSNRSGY